MSPHIRPMQADDSPRIAELHVSGIPTGFISSLGVKAVSAIYTRVVAEGTSFGLVAEQDGDIVGFVAFSSNLPRLYKTMILKSGLPLVVKMVRKFFSLRAITKICQTLLYPCRTRRLALPTAELLAVVVSTQHQGHGLAKKLVFEGLRLCVGWHVNEVKVLVSQENAAANRLYLACGFELMNTFDSHGVPSNIYVYRSHKT